MPAHNTGDCFGSCDGCGTSCQDAAVDMLLARAEKAEAEVTSLHGAVKTLNVTLGLVRYRAEVAEVRATALENALAGIAAAARAHDDHGIAYLCEDALKGNAS